MKYFYVMSNAILLATVFSYVGLTEVQAEEAGKSQEPVALSTSGNGAAASQPAVAAPEENTNEEASAAKEVPAEQTKGDDTVELVRDDTKTKIYACEIRFPLNSVQFNEKNVEDCFKGVDRQRISYIHVVATASPEGTITHNLYLSTRRAGAIEGYLKNRFSDIEIHAFGGGINPKFGKAAQIFVVESGKIPEHEEPIKQVVELKQAPVQVKAPEVQIVTKTEYIQPKKAGIELRIGSGISQFRPQSSDYQFVGAAVFMPLRSYNFGLEYGVHRSNQVYDVHSAKLNAERMYRLWRVSGTSKLEAGPLAYTGVSIIDKDRQMDYGMGAILKYKSGDYTGNVTLGLAKHFRWLGFGVGALL